MTTIEFHFQNKQSYNHPMEFKENNIIIHFKEISISKPNGIPGRNVNSLTMMLHQSAFHEMIQYRIWMPEKLNQSCYQNLFK